ncbi:DJ-1/PfpI family protein [Streptodolium elevatio]|uniref:DJ-1/PfpI family protein n=1 Tax=Streptodolium elevatio TaxID=3157996 RepID=A0ABV3DAJ2_9ACTN
MHVAIPLYPGFTALDAVGPYTVLALTPGCEVSFVAGGTGPVTDDQGKPTLVATTSYADLPAPDIVVVPGGPGTTAALGDRALLDWLMAADAHTKWTTSVCSGSFLLAAAGLLTGRKATSHWGWVEQLAGFGAEPVSERVVFDGKYVTAAGVSSGIDMAIALVARETGERTAQTVQLAIEYDPEPPFDAGSPHKVPADLHAAALALIGT